MKFLHISDLHIGKRLLECSLLEEQEYILNEIVQLVQQHQVDGVLIAGDVYDKNIPLERGVQLFDKFLTNLANLTKVFIISGNHDSAERLDFGSKIMQQQGVYISGTYQGKIPKVKVEDEYGVVNVWLLPFIKPAMVRPFFDEEIKDYTDAVKTTLGGEVVDTRERNVMVAHQFVIYHGEKPEQVESEITNVGGLDDVDGRVFDDFDYVALGHIHTNQRVGRDTMRYCGSPLKYSFDEAKEGKPEKVAILVELKEKGAVHITELPLIPKQDMRIIKGPMEELLLPERVMAGNANDYMEVILTDEEELHHPLMHIREMYPNTLKLRFENSRTKRMEEYEDITATKVEQKSHLELFEEFFFQQNGVEMSEEERELYIGLTEGIGESR